MDIQTLIGQAKARQDAQTEAHRQESEDRAAQYAETLRNQFIAAFGDEMLDTLNAFVSCSPDDVARITFRYQDRNYSLRRRYSDGVIDWMLIWMAPREDGDERRLPFATISEYRRDTERNIDELVLALSQLAEEPDTSRGLQREIPEPPAPRVMNEYEERLIDALREYLQHEL